MSFADFYAYLDSLPDDAARLKAIDEYNRSKEYYHKYGDKGPSLDEGGPERTHTVHGAQKKAAQQTAEQAAKKSWTNTAKQATKQTASRAASGIKTAGRATLNLGRNALTGLSGLSGIAGVVAAPALAGAGWAFMNGVRMDNDGTTRQLANEMNQVFKAGLYVDNEGNYVDANTNEIVGPETAAKRIDAVAAIAPASEEDTLYSPIENTETDSTYKPEPAPMVPVEDTHKASPLVQENPVVISNPLANLNGLSNAELAKAVIRGKYGNGEARKKALGDRYAAVQALVNADQSWRKPAQRKGTEIEGVAFTPRNIPVTPAIREAELANGTQLVLQ